MKLKGKGIREMKKKYKTIDEYIAAATKKLEQIRQIVKQLASQSEKTIIYNMLSF